METTTDTTTCKLYGLYAITPCSSTHPLSTPLLITQTEQAIAGGARIIQYREKYHPGPLREEQARRLKSACERLGALFIVNDDIALAAAVGAHGVHLGRDDGSIRQARERLGATAIIGVSCYNRLALAREAQRQGADYVAFGRFFPSRSKPDAVQADLDLLRQAKGELGVPIACIGGIRAENAKLLLSAGADMLAVIHGVFGAVDITRASRELAACFDAGRGGAQS